MQSTLFGGINHFGYLIKGMCVDI